MVTGTSTRRITAGVTSSISTRRRAISPIGSLRHLQCAKWGAASRMNPTCGAKPATTRYTGCRQSLLFRRLLERQHVLAGLQVDDPAVLDHPREVLAALQHGDVRNGILVEHDQVGELARRELPDLAFETD